MVEASYDTIADWYDNFVRTSPAFTELTFPALLDLAGEVRGQKICDLACGQGLVARELAQRGASVTGLDLSAKLLEIAQCEEAAAPLGLSYLQDDVQTASTQRAASFDGVTCNMALMDIPDLRAVFGTVRRILQPGGWFVFCITHPCFTSPNSGWLPEAQAWGVVNYFQEGFWRSNYPHGVRGKMGAQHRTLGTYLNTLTEFGLTFEKMLEPRPSENLIARFPELKEVPSTLLIRSHKS